MSWVLVEWHPGLYSLSYSWRVSSVQPESTSVPPPSLTLQLWLVNEESAVFRVYTSSQPNMCGKHSMWPGWENLNSLSTSTARPRLIWQRQGDPNHECEFGLGTLGIAQHTAWRDIKHGTCTPRAVFQPESPSVLGSQVTTRGLTSAVLLLPS